MEQHQGAAARAGQAATICTHCRMATILLAVSRACEPEVEDVSAQNICPNRKQEANLMCERSSEACRRFGVLEVRHCGALSPLSGLRQVSEGARHRLQ